MNRIFSAAADIISLFAKKAAASPGYAAMVLLFFALLITAFCIILFRIGLKLGRYEEKQKLTALLQAGRDDAVKRSRAVLSGQMAEQIAPFLKDFPCNPADVRFVGKPLDFIGFPGAADGSGIKEILFIEVKTGNSGLSKREREIKAAVEEGRVRYVEYNPSI